MKVFPKTQLVKLFIFVTILINCVYCIRIRYEFVVEDFLYMKKALLIATVLFIAVISTACINNIAIQELNNKAAEFMQKGDYESAMSRLQASLDLDATMYETYYNLGIAATNAKKYDEAINAFENGIKLKPEHSNFYYSLGVAQSAYADELVETTVYDKDKEDTVEKKVSDEDRAKADALKISALENLKKYLEMEPQAEDKSTVEALIKDCESFGKNNSAEQNKVIEVAG